MRRVGVFLFLLLTFIIPPNGAEVNDKVVLERESFQEIVNKYFQEFYAYANFTRNSRKDVDVFAKVDASNRVGGNQLLEPIWGRSKATEYLLKSEVGKDDLDGGVEGFKKEVEIPTTTASTKTTPPSIISQFLSPKWKPSAIVTLTLLSHQKIFRFEVEKEQTLTPTYFISVVVEKMDCTGNDRLSPTLSVKRDQNEMQLCEQFDSSTDNFQSVAYYLDGNRHVSITGFGNWSSVTANLVVSLYYETDGNDCLACSINDHICCFNEKEACQRSLNSLELTRNSNGMNEGYRCIPNKSQGGSQFCDKHPNCGFRCNFDESKNACSDDHIIGEGDYSTCYTCREHQEDRYLLTLLLLIVFCLIVPFCIFLVFCSRKDIRSELRHQGRCPRPFEILFCPFSMSPENENSSNNAPRPIRRPRPRGIITRIEDTNVPRQAQTGQENFSYFDDLPPSYSECCNNKCMYPNPPKVPGRATPSPSPQEFTASSTTVTVPSSSASSRTVPTESLQVLTISSLLNERPPPSFEFVISEKRSANNSKKKALTSNTSSKRDVSNLTVAVTNIEQNPSVQNQL